MAMVKRLTLVQNICRHVGITRKRPLRKDFSKRELYMLSASLQVGKKTTK